MEKETPLDKGGIARSPRGRRHRAAAGMAALVLGTVLLYFNCPRVQAWLFALVWFLALAVWQRLGQVKDRARIMTCLMDQSQDLFWQLDEDHSLTFLTGAAASVLGRSQDALIQIPLTELLAPDKARAFEILLKDNGPFVMQAGIRQPDNQWLPVEIRGMPVTGGGSKGFAGTIRSLKEKQYWEERLLALENENHRSEKLKNLGLLAGSVAHDLNNILSGIATYPEVLLMDRSLDEKTRNGLGMIKDSGRKASSVVSDLLAISRGARADQQVLNLNTVIQRYLAATEFEKTLRNFPGVDVEVSLEPELFNMRGSYIHMEKAVMNLMLNAVEAAAGRPGAQVVVSSANVYMDEEGQERLGPGEYIRLSVGDNGPGIPHGFGDKIFDPFFAQKEMGRSGTGLGLSLVRNTVQDHKGDIRLASGPDGTRFDLFFPAIRPEMPLAGEADSLEEIRGQGQAILIVDDLPDQRKIGATILTNLGYQVFTAESGMTAVAFVRERPVDLLVLDMVMAPGISGLETFRQIKKIRPDQKAIIASGHSESEDVLKTQELGAGSLVKKPYTIMDMGIAVKEELEK